MIYKNSIQINTKKIKKIKISHPEGTLYSVPKKYICFKPHPENLDFCDTELVLNMTKKKRKKENLSFLSYSHILSLIEYLKSKPKRDQKSYYEYLDFPFFTLNHFNFFSKHTLRVKELKIRLRKNQKYPDKNKITLLIPITTKKDRFLYSSFEPIFPLQQKKISKKTLQGKTIYLETINGGTPQERVQRTSEHAYLDLQKRQNAFFEKVLKNIELSKDKKLSASNPDENWQSRFKRNFRDSENSPSRFKTFEALYETSELFNEDDILFLKNFIQNYYLKKENNSLKSIISGHFSNFPKNIAIKAEGFIRNHETMNILSAAKEPGIPFETTLKNAMLVEESLVDLQQNLNTLSPEIWNFYKIFNTLYQKNYKISEIYPNGIILIKRSLFTVRDCLKHFLEDTTISSHEKIKDKKAYLDFKNEQGLS